MKPHRTYYTIAIAVLMTSAIASAGIYGVVSVFQSNAALLDDAEAAPIPLEDLGDNHRQLPPPRAPRDAGRLLVHVNRLSGGVFVPAGRVEVQVVSDGQILERQTSGQDGHVRLDVSDGIYSLIAKGSEGVAMVRTVLTDDNAEVVLGLCPEVDTPTINSILQRDVFQGETVATLGDGIDPGRWLNLLSGAGFELGDDGTISGRVTRTEELGSDPRSIVNSRVLLIRAGEVVAEGMTNELGEFQLSGVSPGAYSFIVASNLGFIALAAQVHPLQEVVSARGSEVRLVSFDDESQTRFDDGSQVNAEPVPPGDIQAAGGTPGGPGAGGGVGGIVPLGPLGPPGGGGGLGGGGTSGGGGGGLGDGGGILGPLLAGLGGAALGWALSEEDDDDDTASP